MKKKMKKKINRLLAVLATVACLTGMFPVTSQAYSSDTHEYDIMMGYEIKGNDSNAKSTVVMYMYAQVSDRHVNNQPNFYQFKMYRSEFTELPEGRCGYLCYRYNTSNKNVYEELENGEVWVWQFNVENGEYDFLEVGSSWGTGSMPLTYTLSRDYEIPYIAGYKDSMSYEEKEAIKEPIELQDETIRIYTMLGNHNWVYENEAAFAEWAAALDKQIIEQESVMEKNEAESSETIDVDMDAEIATNENAGTEDFPEEGAVESEEVVPEIPTVDAAPEEESKKSGLKENLVTIVVGLAAFAALGLLVYEKKK